ncbi:MAG: cation diffusion facilitator family transporter [Anaerolineales bacterium]
MSIREINSKIGTQQGGVADYGVTVERWGWASIFINLVLSLLNLGIAIASGSLAVVSEMVHNLVDLMASVVVLIGLRISQRKSKSFPYGLYKVENVVSVLLSGLIFFTGYEIVREALFSSREQTMVNLWILAGVMLSAIIPFLFSNFELRAGKAVNSPSLTASALEYRTHIFSSGIVFISLITHYLGLSLDRLAALLVVFFISRTGWEMLKDGMRVLLDASLDADTMAQVRRIIESDPATAQIKGLTGRNSGRYRFLEAEITLRIDDLKKAHDASQRIEKSIRDEVPHVERVLIHYEPTLPTNRCYAFPLANLDGNLSDHFGEAPYFALVSLRLSDMEIEKQEVIHNPFTEVPKAKGIRVAEWLLSKKVDRIVLKENLQGKGPEYVFKNAGVEMIYTNANSWRIALEELGK